MIPFHNRQKNGVEKTILKSHGGKEECKISRRMAVFAIGPSKKGPGGSSSI